MAVGAATVINVRLVDALTVRATFAYALSREATVRASGRRRLSHNSSMGIVEPGSYSNEAYMIGRYFSGILVSALIAPAFSTMAHAAATPEWKPDKRIEMVVPSGPGGGNDRLLRIIQKTMQDRKLADVPVTIVNKPGAGQVVGLAYLNQQLPDGNHIAIVSVSFMTNYITARSPIGHTDIVPIAHLFGEYVGFAVKPDSRVKSAKDLLAMLKADSGSVSASMSGGGAGNHNHLALATVTNAVGGDVRKLKTVSYASGREATLAVLGGHVDIGVAPAATLLPQVQSGQLRMIGITAPKRLDGPFAQVPTWRELGADAVVSNWRAIIATRGTGPQQVAYWENVIARVVETEDWKKMLEDDALTNQFMGSADTRNYLNAQFEELRALLVALGLAK
jgi:putative tricarboxylic transport membrane protein